MRRTFQIALLVTAFVPFILGVMNLVGGAALFVPPEDVTARLDNQMRFYAVASMLPFFIALWIVRNLDVAGPALTITLTTTALTGIARLYSVTQYGLPGPDMIGAVVVEIGVLLFIPWHRMVVRKPKAWEIGQDCTPI